MKVCRLLEEINKELKVLRNKKSNDEDIHYSIKEMIDDQFLQYHIFYNTDEFYTFNQDGMIKLFHLKSEDDKKLYAVCEDKEMLNLDLEEVHRNFKIEIIENDIRSSEEYIKDLKAKINRFKKDIEMEIEKKEKLIKEVNILKNKINI